MISNKTLIEGMFEAALVFNSEGLIIDLNHSAEALFEISREQFTGKKLYDFSFEYLDEEGGVYEGSQNPIFQVFKSRKPLKGRKIQLRLLNGKIKWLQLNAIFLKGIKNRSLESIILTFNDISELVSTRQKVENLNDQLLEKLETLNILTRSFNQAQKISKLGHWLFEPDNNRLVWELLSNLVYG